MSGSSRRKCAPTDSRRRRRCRDELLGDDEQVLVLELGFGARGALVRAPRREDGCRVLEALGVADESGVLPHELLQSAPRVKRPTFADGVAGPQRSARRAGRLGAGQTFGHRPDAASAAIASPARAPKTAPSRSEFDASRFAPCTPVRATSPTAYSPGSVVRPSRSVVDAAHQVVRGRSHRDRLARPVEAAFADGAVDRGEALREEHATSSGVERRCVASRRHRPAVLRLHLACDRAGDDVPRGELAVGVRVEREAAARARR